ncbi:MAG: hypothetical protein WBR28_03285 [Mycobacterium sp.]
MTDVPLTIMMVQLCQGSLKTHRVLNNRQRIAWWDVYNVEFVHSATSRILGESPHDQ